MDNDPVEIVDLAINSMVDLSIVTRWGPPVIRWFINPMNTIVIGTTNHSYGSYKPT